MKMYFSKLTKVLLAGVALVAVGCTDYGQDIDNLNQKLDNDIVAGMIEPLQADLEKAVADLEAAQAALKAELTTKHDADVKTLQDADAALDGKIAAANQSILDLQAALAAEKKALQDAIAAGDNALAAQIADLTAKHNADVAALQKQMQDNVAAVEAQFAAVAEQVKGLNAKDAELEAALAKKGEEIAALTKTVNDNYDALTAALAAAKTDLQGQIDALTATVEGLEEDLLELVGEFADYKTEIAGKLATMEAAHAALEARVAKLETEIIPALQAAIAENKQGIADLNAWVAEVYAELTAADVALAEAIALLDGRVEDLEAFRATLEQELAEHYAAFEAVKGELAEAIATEAAHYNQLYNMHLAQDEILKGIIADLKAEAEARAAQDEVLEGYIDGLEARVLVLEQGLADLKESHEALAAEFVAFQEETVEIIKAIEIKDNQQDGRISVNEEDIAKLKNADKELQKSIEALATAVQKALDAEKKARENADAALQEQINSILGMIQSVVYVPEYTDGKATVDYAYLVSPMQEMFVVEGYSTITYQVYPAECADAIAVLDAKNVADYLSLQLTDELKVRNAAVNGPALKVVGVEKGAKEGYIVVTYQANNLGQAFYKGEVEYAVSLHVDANNSCLSSCYTNLVAASEPKVEIFPAIVPTVAVAQEIEYLKPGVANALPLFPEGLAVVYNVNSEVYNLAKMQEMGWVLAEAPATPKKIVYNVDATEYTGTKTLFEAGDVEGVENYWLAADVESEHVGMYADHYRGFAINGQVTLYSVSTLEIAPDTAVVPFNAIHFKWYYTADAAQDAAATPNYARTNVALTVNEEYYTENPDDKTDLTWEEITAVAPAVTVNGQEMGDTVFTLKVVDGKPVVDVTNFSWKNANGEPMTYDVTFKYNLPVATVKVTVKVTTEDRSREKMTFEFKHKSYEFFKNMDFTPFSIVGDKDATILDIAELYEKEDAAPIFNLAEVYEKINATYDLGLNSETDGFASDKKNIDVERQTAFLKEVFAVFVSDPKKAVYKRVATGFEGETVTKTLPEDVIKHFSITLADTAQAVSLGYSYLAYDFIPHTIDYTVTYTLWYGQVVELHAQVELNKPTRYNYRENQIYVKLGGLKNCSGSPSFNGGFEHDQLNTFFSTVYPNYDPKLTLNGGSDKKGVQLDAFDTDKVDMDKAFDITDNDEQIIFSDDIMSDMDAYKAELFKVYGLESVFEIEEDLLPTDYRQMIAEYNAKVPGDAYCRKLEFNGNQLTYNADICHVDVKGNLYLVNTKDNGEVHSKLKLDTYFEGDQRYSDYVVKKYDPIAEPKVKPSTYVKHNERDADTSTPTILDVEISSAQKYVIHPLYHIEVKDWRNGYYSYDLINRETGAWIMGDGKNGFGEGRSVTEDIYHIIYDLDPMDNQKVPDYLKKVIIWDKGARTLTFDNTAEQVLVEPVVYNVVLKISSPWGTYNVTIPVRFYQGGDLGKTE